MASRRDLREVPAHGHRLLHPFLGAQLGEVGAQLGGRGVAVRQQLDVEPEAQPMAFSNRSSVVTDGATAPRSTLLM
jgi:hypothetical protein